jgi:hemerythrin-like domain-containing protein
MVTNARRIHKGAAPASPGVPSATTPGILTLAERDLAEAGERMAHAIYLLRLEHGNIARLLEVLDDQALAIGRGEEPDQDVLVPTLEYFASYPDACHHPKEELVLRHLRTRNPRAAKRLDGLEREHAALERQTRDLLARVSGDAPGPHQVELHAAIPAFCRTYRQHMDAEEHSLFPVALESLTEEDWAAISFDLFDRDDPLFDHSLEEQFAQLRMKIAQRAEVAHDRRHADEEERWLQSIDNVEAFNARMHATGRDVRLIPFHEGGYGIEHGGALLAHLPPCSAVRAAWCAWFFWRGVESDIYPRSKGGVL